MKCERCEDIFPPELVQAMFAGEESFNVCGVCALELTREIHGAPGYMFHGEQARSVYERSKAHKAKLRVYRSN